VFLLHTSSNTYERELHAYNQRSGAYHSSSSPKRPPPKPTSASSSLAAGFSSFLASVLAGAAVVAPPAAAPELPPLTKLIHNIQYSLLPKETVESFLDPAAMT